MFDFHQFDTRAMLAFVLLGVIWAPPLFAQQDQALHPKYSVQFFQLQVENQDLRMAFRDVEPTGASNGKACSCSTERISPAFTGNPPSSWRSKAIASLPRTN
jgi:hypothetical protein